MIKTSIKKPLDMLLKIVPCYLAGKRDEDMISVTLSKYTWRCLIAEMQSPRRISMDHLDGEIRALITAVGSGASMTPEMRSRLLSFFIDETPSSVIQGPIVNLDEHLFSLCQSYLQE